MKKLKRIAEISLINLGFVNLGYMVASLVYGDIVNINVLCAMDVICIQTAILSFIIFKEKVSPLEKWIRRSILLVISTVTVPIYFVLFGWVKGEMIEKMLPFTMIFIFIFPAVSLLIGDIIEKKHIERINRKLSQNKSEE